VARGLSGELVVGFVEAAMASGALPAALARLGARAPLVRVELREATSVEQVDALCRKALDVALVYVPPRADDPLLAAELLWPDPLAAVLPPGHALAGRAAVTLAELGATSGALPLVCFRRALAPERYDDVLRACAAGGYAPDRVQETTQFQSVVSLAAGGVGVGLAPASFRALAPAGATGGRGQRPRGAVRRAPGHAARQPAARGRRVRRGGPGCRGRRRARPGAAPPRAVARQCRGRRLTPRTASRRGVSPAPECPTFPIRAGWRRRAA
jgi:DNA-binding transcriptional LysR family regulator